MTANPVRHRTMALVTATLLAAAINFHPANAIETNTIVMKDFDFAPMSLNVAAGTTVVWKNLDDEPHTVVGDKGLFRSGGLEQNDTFAFKFDKPGTYKFLCSIHPKMMGTIVVK
jgi:plastocyanin